MNEKFESRIVNIPGLPRKIKAGFAIALLLSARFYSHEAP
jgi:hypothetical protein